MERPDSVEARMMARARRADEKVKAALEKRDAVAYVRICDYYGRAPECLDLYQQGKDILEMRDSAPTSEISNLVDDEHSRRNVEQARANAETVRAETVVNSDEREYWSNLVRVALPSFPPTAPGEIVHAREIRQRLSQIRSAGYELRAYGRMNRNDLLNYLAAVRGDISAHARSACPEVLEQVIETNRKRDEELRYAR